MSRGESDYDHDGDDGGGEGGARIRRYRGFSTSISSLFLDESLVCGAVSCFGLILSQRSEHLLNVRNEARGLVQHGSSGRNSGAIRKPSKVVGLALIVTLVGMATTYAYWGFGNKYEGSSSITSYYDFFDDGYVGGGGGGGDDDGNDDDAAGDDRYHNQNMYYGDDNWRNRNNYNYDDDNSNNNNNYADDDGGNNGNYNNNYNNYNQQQYEEAEWGSFGFDPSNYSLKYTACSAIAEINENADENAESITITRRFVVFRLCPTDTCGSYQSLSDDMDTSTASFASNVDDAAADFDGNLGSNYLGSNGCGDSYGEYLVPLEAYVEEYATYKEELSEVYCQYCEQCLYFEQYFYNNNRHLKADGNKDRDLGADDYYEMDDDAAAAAEYADQNGEEKHQEAQEEDTYAEFLGCVNWGGGGNDNYGNAYYYDGLYIGPQCAEDGYTIEFGVFSDEYCSAPVQGTSVSKITGIEDFGADYLSSFHDNECITCQESVSFFIILEGPTLGG